MKWYDFKYLVEKNVGVPLDALHAPLGLALYLVVAVAMRRYRWGPTWALLPVVLLQGVNEALDARDWLRWTGAVPWAEAAIDTLATLALPTAVACVWMITRNRNEQ